MRIDDLTIVVSSEEYCFCDDYKWLNKKLDGMAIFLFIHGQECKENRGPFKFCPYCGKRVKP